MIKYSLFCLSIALSLSLFRRGHPDTLKVYEKRNSQQYLEFEMFTDKVMIVSKCIESAYHPLGGSVVGSTACIFKILR